MKTGIVFEGGAFRTIFSCGISSSVVVTGSVMSETTLRSISSVSELIAGQSVILGPNLSSTELSALPYPS